MTMRKTNVGLYLGQLANLFEEREKDYGKNYLIAGDALKVLFTQGLNLETAEELNRFALFNQMVNKLMRYGQNIKKGGHVDSLDDLAVYAMMTKEADAMFAAAKKRKK